MRSWHLVITIVGAGVAGCALVPGGSRSASVAPVASMTDTAAVATAPPVVQVRGFSRSSIVSVVAWDVDDAAFGLRTEISRTGRLVGGDRLGDHRLYVTPFYAWYQGGYRFAYAVPGKPLLPVGGSDSYACYYGAHCTPMVTVGVRVPDALLRANRDSLVVTFLPAGQTPWTITLRRELIAAYLTTVDSVVAEMRRVSSR
jgi:hypothetical protein